MKKSKVAVVACPDYEPAHVKESLQKGLEAIGGLESLIGKEENILLKPNLVRSAKRERAVVTDPVDAACRWPMIARYSSDS